MLFQGYEYHKSYLLTKETNVSVDKAKVIQLNDFLLYCSEDLNVSEGKHESIRTFMLGYALHIEDANKTDEQIAEELAQCYANEKQFHTYLDELGGRFVLIVCDDKTVKVYPDATTMRSICYSEVTNTLASHARIVYTFDQMYHETTYPLRNFKVNGFLDYTKFEGIYKLIPNNYRDMESKTNVRFFPHEQFTLKDNDQILKALLPYLNEERKWLQDKDTFLSFTGGIDSRVSLSIMHDRNLPLLTYISDNPNKTAFAKKAYANDKKIVEEIAHDLNLNHHMLMMNRKAVTEQFKNVYNHKFESAHSSTLAYEYTQLSQYKDKLQIRSTILEMGKKVYNTEVYNDNDFDAYYRIIHFKAPDSLKALPDFKAQIIEPFLKRTCTDVHAITSKGYFIADFHYHEQRMGNWHSNIVQETDGVFDQFAFFNCRKLMYLIASQPIDVRAQNELFKQIIYHFWKVLLFYPINEKQDLLKQSTELHTQLKALQTMNKLSNDISIKHSANIEQTDNTFQPVLPIQAGQKYETLIKNVTKQPLTINVKGHYNNPLGKGNIFVKLNNEEYDILDLYKGQHVTIQRGKKLYITVTYKKDFDKISWAKAGKVSIEIV
ncbi:hypothetical protein [Macrococcoides canis]|uniref:hypothetical protein n=1 Tax=Macrococcoides canis TaxID=1855823 RepID=UPI0020B659AB|nr:hypothetical protein [Macrococcus canis]UTH07658.1 hypothetical protein KFV07_04390 [Macrococcus canis]